MYKGVTEWLLALQQPAGAPRTPMVRQVTESTAAWASSKHLATSKWPICEEMYLDFLLDKRQFQALRIFEFRFLDPFWVPPRQRSSQYIITLSWYLVKMDIGPEAEKNNTSTSQDPFSWRSSSFSPWKPLNALGTKEWPHGVPPDLGKPFGPGVLGQWPGGLHLCGE